MPLKPLYEKMFNNRWVMFIYFLHVVSDYFFFLTNNRTKNHYSSSIYLYNWVNPSWEGLLFLFGLLFGSILMAWKMAQKWKLTEEEKHSQSPKNKEK